MAGRKTGEVVVRASVDDAYDGTVRLLGDAQRFGLTLRAISLQAGEGGSSILTLTIDMAERIDDGLLASRFARHPGVSRVALEQRPTDAVWVQSEPLAA